jgi:hypothetical protein
MQILQSLEAGGGGGMGAGMGGGMGGAGMGGGPPPPPGAGLPPGLAGGAPPMGGPPNPAEETKAAQHRAVVQKLYKLAFRAKEIRLKGLQDGTFRFIPAKDAAEQGKRDEIKKAIRDLFRS